MASTAFLRVCSCGRIELHNSESWLTLNRTMSEFLGQAVRDEVENIVLCRTVCDQCEDKAVHHLPKNLNVG